MLGPRQGVPAPQGPNPWPFWPGEECTSLSLQQGPVAFASDHFITDLAAARWCWAGDIFMRSRAEDWGPRE